MNERIKQLAEQCRGNPMTSEFEPIFDKEKFAELLLREAAKFVDLADENKCEAIGDNLLIYFGVEE